MRTERGMTKEKQTKNERLERGVKKVLSVERPEEDGRAPRVDDDMQVWRKMAVIARTAQLAPARRHVGPRGTKNLQREERLSFSGVQRWGVGPDSAEP